MSKIIDTIIGNLDEKREYKKNEERTKALPAEYAIPYKEMKNYIFRTSRHRDNGTAESAC